MKLLRTVRRGHVVIAITAVALALILVSIHVLAQAAFGVAIAIAGGVGALMVVYEVSLTKRLAQAEFIRDLQTGFASDPNICELWRKMLLDEEITMADRGRVSSYLTFFETLYILLRRGALDPDLTDDLFRNRFFTAIGNKGVLETALVKEAGSFANIHDLIEKWHDYLLKNDVPIHPGYYRYIKALTEAKGYEIVELGEPDLADLMQLQTQIVQGLRPATWLRENTEAMLKACLVDHVTLGARCGGELVAAAVLFDAGSTEENIKHYFTTDPQALTDSINLKLVFALPQHRKRGLSRVLVELLEERAVLAGKTEIMCTIDPANKPSASLFKLLGYHEVDTVATTYGRRAVYARTLPVINRRWAR